MRVGCSQRRVRNGEFATSGLRRGDHHGAFTTGSAQQGGGMRSTNPGRFAGLLYVVMSVFGFFAMAYVPGKLMVHGDATATINNVATHETLFRLGIASQLIGQAGFIFVALAL